ncbi:putative FBD-associated F-box protein [Capsicum annuum]|uniref:putative FBD-associated F-box protein At5g56820 n=1 Tax=Capsicum annuum TaxID=4072 RepID=UPI001FB08594|nr:putative FBD-associated F-box protein At5g56820 [Capsicum annuum]
MEENSDVTCDDRISKLPEPILHHILSFLHAKDAARMSTLSKVWDSAWNSLPYLNFGDKSFSKSKDILRLLRAVDQALANRKKHKISIQKFSLWLPHHHELCYVSSWINMLIACNVKELNLEVNIPIYKGIYLYNRLPKVIFAAKALNVLTLEGFNIEFPTGDGVIKLSSLRELNLLYVFLDEQSMQALCTSCHNLEHLSLWSICGLASFQVGENSLPKLKKVNLEYCSSKFQLVDIAAINLEDLKIYSLDRSPKVVKITACKALKTLHLKGVNVTENWLEDLFNRLQNLESFNLTRCKDLKNMKITSGSLKWLTALRCGDLIAADLDTPNLLKLQCSFYPLSTFKLKASVLLEATLQLYPKFGTCGWHSKLMEFLANFNHSKAIKFSCFYDKEIVIPKDLRENLLPPLYGTNILHVTFQRQSNYSVVDIIDSMLWISPHLDTLSFTQAHSLKTVKFIYEDDKSCWRNKLKKVKLHNFTCMEKEKLRNYSLTNAYILDEDEKPCCASLPWKCWRHTLKKVELQNFTLMEQEKMRNYFVANADLSEMIEISLD